MVKGIVGPYGGTYEDGCKLYQELCPLLESSQRVELGFEGMRLAFSSFFSGAIGNLIHESSGDSLPVSFRNFTPRDRFVLDHTLKALRLGADMTAIEA